MASAMKRIQVRSLHRSLLLDRNCCGGDETTEPGADTGDDTGGGSGDDAGAEEDAGAAEDAGATTDTGNGEDAGATTDTGNGEDTGGTPDASEDASADAGEDTVRPWVIDILELRPRARRGDEPRQRRGGAERGGTGSAAPAATSPWGKRPSRTPSAGRRASGTTCSSLEVNRTADGPRVRFGTRYLVRPADLEGATPTQRADCVGGAVLTDQQTTVNEGLIRGVTGDCILVSLADDESGLRLVLIRNLPQLQFVDEIIGTPDIPVDAHREPRRRPRGARRRDARARAPARSRRPARSTIRSSRPRAWPACETALDVRGRRVTLRPGTLGLRRRLRGPPRRRDELRPAYFQTAWRAAKHQPGGRRVQRGRV